MVSDWQSCQDGCTLCASLLNQCAERIWKAGVQKYFINQFCNFCMVANGGENVTKFERADCNMSLWQGDFNLAVGQSEVCT